MKQRETERLILRQMQESDYDNVVIYRLHPDVRCYIPDYIDEAGVKAYVERSIHPWKQEENEPLRIVMELKGTSKVIGELMVKIVEKNIPMVEIGYALNPEFQGKGYTTEAMHNIMQFVFEDLSINRVIGEANPENIASRRIMEKMGMKQEAHLIQHTFFNNKIIDTVIYGILKKDWKAN